MAVFLIPTDSAVVCECNDNELLKPVDIAKDIARFNQRVSIASYANRWYSQRKIVRPFVRPSHSGIVSKRKKLAS